MKFYETLFKHPYFDYIFLKVFINNNIMIGQEDDHFF